MGKVIPTANALNVNFENVASAMALATSKGIATAESTTYLNSMLGELGKSGTKVSDALKKHTGKTFQQLMNDGNSLSDVLNIVSGIADKNKISLSDMFGSAEAGRMALVLASEDGKQFNDMLKTMNESAGESEKAFQKMDNTLRSRIDKIIQRVKGSFIQLGEAMLPLIEGKILPAIEKFSNWLANLDEETINNMASWVEWGVKIGGALLIGGKLLTWGSSMITSFSGLTSVLTGTATATTALGGGASLLSSAMALLTNPIALATAGIVALGGAFIYSQKKLNESTDEFIKGGEKLEDFDGRIRTSENLWTRIFGKKYKFQLSEDFEEHKNTVSNISDNVIGIFETTQQKIGEILNQDLPVQTQQEQIQAHYDEMYRQLEEQWHKVNVTNDENYNRNAVTLAGHLNTQTNLEESTKDKILAQYEDFYNSQKSTIDSNNLEIEQIYRNHLDTKGQLTAEGEEKINTLLAENQAISETLSQTNADNIIQILNRFNEEKIALYGKDAKEVKKSDLDKIQSAKDWASETKDQLDLSRQNMLKFTKGNAEETAKVHKQFDDLVQGVDAFSFDYMAILERCIKGGMSYEQATQEAMNNVIRKAEETGGSVPDSLANIIQAMVDSKVSSDDLTEAMKAIPPEIRAEVLAKVDGKDNVDALKSAIDKVQSKKVFITAEHRMTGNTMYAKGTEGVSINNVPKRAMGDENFANTQTALVGEQGAELVELPRGAKVKTHRETNNITGNSQQPPLVAVQIDGRTIATVLSKYISEGLGQRNRQLGFGGAY